MALFCADCKMVTTQHTRTARRRLAMRRQCWPASGGSEDGHCAHSTDMRWGVSATLTALRNSASAATLVSGHTGTGRHQPQAVCQIDCGGSVLTASPRLFPPRVACCCQTSTSPPRRPHTCARRDSPPPSPTSCARSVALTDSDDRISRILSLMLAEPTRAACSEVVPCRVVAARSPRSSR